MEHEIEESTEIVIPPITSAEGIMEQHEGWERPPTPEMMPIRYDKYDGWTGQEIQDHLQVECDTMDPNQVREEQIQQLEGLMTGLDFWPAALEIFQKQQTQLAGEISYTGTRRKHERRDLETILKQCHEEMTTPKRDRSDA